MINERREYYNFLNYVQSLFDNFNKNIFNLIFKQTIYLTTPNDKLNSVIIKAADDELYLNNKIIEIFDNFPMNKYFNHISTTYHKILVNPCYLYAACIILNVDHENESIIQMKDKILIDVYKNKAFINTVRQNTFSILIPYHYNMRIIETYFIKKGYILKNVNPFENDENILLITFELLPNKIDGNNVIIV